eukprot:scaffold2820_cov160-Amphora_coffeaeformis.AAC.4
MCIIRQLMYKHSIIDCYPRILNTDETSSFGSAPDACESDVSSCEASPTSFFKASSSISSQVTRPFDKTSQDAEIFRKIAESMPAKSLLHMLHGIQQTSVNSSNFDDSEVAPFYDLPIKSRQIKIRFAEQADGQVKCDVHEIPRVSDPELWWQAEECSSIRAGCKSLAEHFQLYQEDYNGAIRRLMNLGREVNRTRVENAMACILRNSICRGLENHVVKSSRIACAQHIRHVLRAQDEVYESLEDHTEEGWERIRQASCQTSLNAKLFASKLAQHDIWQALGASRGELTELNLEMN